jgi:PAS domain S-box-containing protein
MSPRRATTRSREKGDDARSAPIKTRETAILPRSLEKEPPANTGDQDRLRALAESVSEQAIFTADRDGRVSSWSAAAERIHGFRAEEVTGRHISMLYPPQEIERGKPELDLGLALCDGRYSEEGRRLRKGGEGFWADVTIIAVADATRRPVGFTIVFREIRHKFGPSESLRQSEERLRLMVEGVRDYAIFMLDPEGYVRSWNAGAERLKGYKADEIIGQHFSQFYTEDAKQIGHPQEELRCAKAEGRYEEEGWRVRKDKTLFWANVVITAVFDAESRHIGFVKVTRDMTERRAAEERLRLSEERLRLLIENVRDYAIFMLDPQGLVMSWNPGAQNIKGYRADEIIGKHVTIFYPPEEVAAGRAARGLEVARANGRYEEEGWRVRKNGERFWASVVLTAVYDAKKELRGFAKVTRDLTERRRLDEERQRAENEAVQQRIRTAEAETAVKIRDEFISVAAHELRTPLTALHLKLQTTSQSLEKWHGESGDDRIAKLGGRMQQAIRQVDRLGELIERLLDFSRIAGKKLALSVDEADLVELVRQVVDDMRDTSGGVELRLDAPTSIVGTWDRARLEQVMVNLLSNAIKYGRGQPVDVVVQAVDSGVRISVTDRGIGIAPKDVDRIFAPFERAVPMAHYGGLGLGLYVTRNIVEAHGGSISVSSGANQGSTFIVDLPLHAAADETNMPMTGDPS